MTVRWEDINARASGLGLHLLPRSVLEALSHAPDLETLAVGLTQSGIPPAVAGLPTAAELELSARQEVARRFRVLSRWLGSRSAALAVAFDDEDRRSLRALLRGALAGVPAESRLAGLVPTPTLPERALEDLAHRASPWEIATLLSLWSHPFGTALVAAIDPEHPDLVRMELALHRVFAERARRGARSGGAELRTYVEETIDVLNAQAALLLSGAHHEVPVEEAFVPGGRVLSKNDFLQAASAGGTPQAAGHLAPLFAGLGLEAALRHAGHHPEALERSVLAQRLATWRARARTAPLSAAPVLHYLLRLRAQLLQIRELIWATALAVPVATRLSRLVEK